MALNKKSKIALYAPNDEDLLDEIVIDFFNKQYDYNGNIDKRELIDTRENSIREFCVDRELFDAVFGVIKHLYGGEYWVEELCYDFRIELDKEYNAKEANRPVMPKEKVWKALRGQLSRKELQEVRSDDYRYESDDYYDFDLSIKMVHELMSGKKTIGYFALWCAVFMECLDSIDCENKELQYVYEEISRYLDGAVFDGSLIAENKVRECRKMIAYLKHFDHRVRDLKSAVATDFTTNGVITYVSFAFGLNNGSGSVYRVCIVDTRRKTINYLYVPKIEYSEGVNYTFLSEAEFDELPTRYYEGFSLDYTMGPKYAVKGATRLKG